MCLEWGMRYCSEFHRLCSAQWCTLLNYPVIEKFIRTLQKIWSRSWSGRVAVRVGISVTILGDLLDFEQLFKAFGIF